MLRVVLVGLVCLAACKDRETKPTPQVGSAGSEAPPPAAPPKLPDAYARLVGARTATMGSALAPVKLGEAIEPENVPQVPATSFGFLGETEPRLFKRATDDPGPKVVVNLEIRAGRLFAIRADLLTDKGAVPDDKTCDDVARALETKWGAAAERVWIDRDAHVRVALEPSCKLVFERYVDVAQWIGSEPASIVPVALVGKKASELATRVGSGVKLDENITYRDAGVGEHASGPSLIDVHIKKGTISGFAVETTVGTGAERAAIRERISTAFAAKPTRDDTTGYDVWATKPPIRMLERPRGVRVEVGNTTL